MRSTVFFGHVAAARRRRAGGAFTLIEAIVVLVIFSILAGIAAVAFQSVSRRSQDSAGKPVLGAAQSEARRVASSNGYTFPSDLVTRLGERTAKIDGKGTARVGYTPDASYAPNTPAKNATGAYQVSTASAGSVAAFAVETTTGHCWTMADRTNSAVTGVGVNSEVKRATTWGYSDNTPPGACKADVVLTCPEVKAAGSPDHPSDAAAPCPVASTVPTLSPVRCNIAELTGSTATVSWTEPDDMTGIVGYRVYAWTGRPDATDLKLATAAMIVPAATLGPLPTGTTETVVNGLVSGTDYTFAVVPESAGTGDQPWTRSDKDSITKLTSAQVLLPAVRVLPAAPTPVTSEQTAAYVGLTWPKADGASTYTVTRSLAGQGSYSELTTVDAVDPQPPTYTYQDTSAKYGEKYDYQIRSSSDVITSELCGTRKTSGGVSGPTTVGPLGLALETPVLTATTKDLSDGGFADDVELTWQEIAGATGFDVYRDGTLIDTLGTATSYEDLDRAHGAKHDYYVIAFVQDLRSAPSNTATAYIQMDKPTLTAAAVDAQGDGRVNDVRLTWPIVPNASGYDLFTCVGSACDPTVRVTGTISGSVGSFVDSAQNLPEGRAYTYKLIARAANGPAVTDTTSDPVSVTLTLPAPVLTGTKVDAANDGNVNDAKLTWNSVPGAVGYRVYRDGTLITTLGSGVTTYTDANRPDGSTQRYQVGAYNAITESKSNTVRIDIALDAPDPTARTIDDDRDGNVNDIRISWPTVSGSGITYDVYRTGYGLIGSTPLTFRIDNDRPWASTSCYTVRARNSSGVTSLMSDETCADVALPAPVITATDIDNTVKVSWAPVPGATAYRVYRAPVVSGGAITSGTLLTTTSGAASSYTDTGRAWGTSYTYAVVALAGTDLSPASNIASALIRPATPGVGLQTTYCGKCLNTITVSYPTGAKSMTLYRNGTAIKTFTPGTNAQGSTWSDPVARGTAWRYSMSATNTSGTSPRSAESVAYQPPDNPTLSVSISNNRLYASWSKETGAERYYLYVDGANKYNGTATSWDMAVNAGQSYAVQVYAYDSNSGRFSPASQVKVVRAPFYAPNGHTGDGVHVYLPGQGDWYIGSFVASNVVGYCIDLFSRGAETASYTWTMDSSIQKQVGYKPLTTGTGLDGVTGAWMTGTERAKVNRALSTYGASKSNTTAAAMNDFVRRYTAGDAAQRNEVDNRWNAMMSSSYGPAIKSASNTIKADNKYYGPYRAKVTYLSKPSVGDITTVRIEALDADGQRVPNAVVILSMDKAYSPGTINTGSDGVTDLNIRADCSGTMTAKAYLVNVDAGDGPVPVGEPNNRMAQRLLGAGYVDTSDVFTYTSGILM